MKPIYLKLVFDRKKRAGKNHEGAVEVRLTHDRRTLYYATGVRLLPKHWHDGQVVNRIDAQELQQQLDIIIKHIRQTMCSLMGDGCCTLDNLMSKLREQDNGKLSFLDFCEQRANVRCYGKSKDSKERYERFMRFLAAYGRITTFADITDDKIMEMDAHLKEKGMKPYSKWNNYHRFLNSFILDAIDAGHMTRNPYKWLRIEKEKSKGGIGKYLTMDEFRRIERLSIKTPHLERVRDLFVFQTYTCLAYVDLASFDASKIRYISDTPVYTGLRGKNGQQFTFILLPPAMAILKKYDNHLPIITNEKYNEYLKAVALMGDIDKPISSHWARHTGATMLLNEGGMDMEIVAKVLGHSSTRITRQVYAKLLDETVLAAMKEAGKKIT